MSHKDKPHFDPNKFTPATIHNKLDLDLDELTKYFRNDNTIGDCAKKFNCSKVTIKRKLRSVGVDTSIYNHSEIAKSKSAVANNVSLPSDDDLKYMLIDRNLDTKTVADLCGVHFNTIRKNARRIGIKKSPKDVSRSMMSRHHRIHGCSHPSQRADVLIKTRRSQVRINYTDILNRQISFRSFMEFEYALYLDYLRCEWYYEEMRVPYVDMLTGKHRMYTIDFTIVSGNNVYWIEVKPNNNMIPNDKRIYASRRAEEAGVQYRGLLDLERVQLRSVFDSGFRIEKYEYINNTPSKSAKSITRWFKNQEVMNHYRLSGWKRHSDKKINGHLYSLKMVRS